MPTTRALFSFLAPQLMIAGFAGCAVEGGDVAEDGSDRSNSATASVTGDLAYVPRIHSTTAVDIEHARGGLQCLTALMQNTYASTRQANICGVDLESDYSDEYVALYSGVDHGDPANPVKTRRVVLAFTGTHKASDWIRNIESQIAVYLFHTNPMTGRYTTGSISGGWTDRWYNQATQSRYHLKVPVGTVASRMKEHVRLAKGAGEQIVFYVTGHSLGAAVGDVAGYDIASWLSEDTIKQEVVVATFDMPRYGYEGIRGQYQDRLANACSEPSASIPVAKPFSTYDQIYWNTSVAEPNERQVYTGRWPFRQIRTLAYCPQFNAPAITWNPLKAVDNHDYKHWTTDVNNLSSEHLLCMFRRPGLAAVASSTPQADSRAWSLVTYAGQTRRVLDIQNGALTMRNASGANARFHLVDAGDHSHVLIQQSGGSQCLDLINGVNSRAGDRMSLSNCDSSKVTQSWTVLSEDFVPWGRTSLSSTEPESFYLVNQLTGLELCPFDPGGTGSAALVTSCPNSSRWTFQP
jgi:Lipase (class 3)